jgi:hypothetical protein
MAQPSNPPPKWMIVGLAIAFLGSVAAVYQIVATAIEKVAAGQGHLTYRTVWLYEFTYSGVLILFVASLLALLVASGFCLREWWLWRDFERKYGGRSNDA